MSLKAPNWVNDEVINFNLSVLRNFYEEADDRIIGYLGPFFLTQLLSEGDETYDKEYVYNYSNVRCWGKKLLKGVNPLDHDVIISFWNIRGSHWSLVLIFPKHKVIESCDSMNADHDVAINGMMRWFYDEISEHYPSLVSDIEIEKWQLFQKREINKQHNGYDCGVFAICWTIALATGVHLKSVNQAAVTVARNRLLVNIIGENDPKKMNHVGIWKPTELYLTRPPDDSEIDMVEESVTNVAKAAANTEDDDESVDSSSLKKRKYKM